MKVKVSCVQDMEGGYVSKISNLCNVQRTDQNSSATAYRYPKLWLVSKKNLTVNTHNEYRKNTNFITSQIHVEQIIRIFFYWHGLSQKFGSTFLEYTSEESIRVFNFKNGLLGHSIFRHTEKADADFGHSTILEFCYRGGRIYRFFSGIFSWEVYGGIFRVIYHSVKTLK